MSDPEGEGPTPEGPSAPFARLVIAVANDLLEHRDELNRLDGVAGDGDLGLTVSTASKALIELAPALATLPRRRPSGSAAWRSPAARPPPAAR